MKNIEFYVEMWVTGESRQLTVIGRCGDEPIELGDTFDVVFRYKHRKYPEEVGDEPIREVERPASLRVVCIHAYEKSLHELGQGMTGSLVLEGDDAHAVAPGWVLGQRDPARDLIGQDLHRVGG